MKAALLLLAIFIAIPRLTAAAELNARAVATPTSYHDMVIELKSDELLSLLVHLSVIGHSAKVKRAIYMVQIGKDLPSMTHIMILCRQHGDEPSGTEAALAFIRKMSKDTSAAEKLRSACFYIVPMVNPDGAEAGTRLSGVGADLNRDWGVFHQPETKAVQKAVERVHPELILDVHSWDMIDPFQQVCLEGPRQAPISAKLLLEVANLQARAAYGLNAAASTDVAATTYGTSSDPTLAHRYFLRSDHIASLLFETGPGPNYGSSLSQRTALVEHLFSWLLKDTTLHPDAWKRLASAEPEWKSVPALPKATSPDSVVVVAELAQPHSSFWLLFVAACAMLGWIVLKSRRPPGRDRLAILNRQKRLQNTAQAFLQPSDCQDLKQCRRRSAERLAYVKELKAHNKIGFRERIRPMETDLLKDHSLVNPSLNR